MNVEAKELVSQYCESEFRLVDELIMVIVDSVALMFGVIREAFICPHEADIQRSTEYKIELKNFLETRRSDPVIFMMVVSLFL
jgi:hypothetical protein